MEYQNTMRQKLMGIDEINIETLKTTVSTIHEYTKLNENIAQRQESGRIL